MCRSYEPGVSDQFGSRSGIRTVYSYYVPFMVYYLVADIGMSVVIVYLIFTGRFALPKWMAVFQPAGGLLLSEIFMRIPFVWCNDLAVAFESMGHLLMFLAAFLLLQDNIFQKK